MNNYPKSELIKNQMGNEFTHSLTPHNLIMEQMLKDNSLQGLGMDAICVYMLFLQRLSFSAYHGMADEHNYLFIYYPLEELVKTCHIGKDKVIKLLKQLETYGLITRVKQGFKKANRIYIHIWDKQENIQQEIKQEPKQESKDSLIKDKQKMIEDVKQPSHTIRSNIGKSEVKTSKNKEIAGDFGNADLSILTYKDNFKSMFINHHYNLKDDIKTRIQYQELLKDNDIKKLCPLCLNTLTSLLTDPHHHFDKQVQDLKFKDILIMLKRVAVRLTSINNLANYLKSTIVNYLNTTKTPNSFNNFEQRKYTTADISDLERALLML